MSSGPAVQKAHGSLSRLTKTTLENKTIIGSNQKIRKLPDASSSSASKLKVTKSDKPALSTSPNGL